MSCFGPGSHPGCPMQEAIQGPGADHNQESLQDSVFAHRYESDPVLSDIQKGGVCLHVVALRAVKERKGETDRGSGGVQGRFFASRLTLQESQIASGSRYTPLFLPFPPPYFPLSFLPSQVFLLLSLFVFYSGSCDGPSCWAAWHRTMSVGKQSLSRIPLSLWQSSSPMKPYQ